MISVALVLKSGGAYDVEYVSRLADQIRTFLPLKHRIFCFTDVDADMLPNAVTGVPFAKDLPGWWAKMNLFSGVIDDDIFYLDLDTILTGDITDLATFGRLAIMRDVYRSEGQQSAIMWIPKSEKRGIWRTFNSDPDGFMELYQSGGDQIFLERIWGDRSARFQDTFPGQIVSYKANQIEKRGVPRDARAVVFHGNPKPRDIGWVL